MNLNQINILEFTIYPIPIIFLIDFILYLIYVTLYVQKYYQIILKKDTPQLFLKNNIAVNSQFFSTFRKKISGTFNFLVAFATVIILMFLANLLIFIALTFYLDIKVYLYLSFILLLTLFIRYFRYFT
ncbi:hypothetical protein DA803_01840 [[Mycoplasma] phocae]|uniref:Uncharacterized protein n=1 Tax=[Mycoplasma] phocae TaxID=142651 RepID=A0A2Z5IRC5_9BACT|nr:hypothetical protein DA803_01840 [[Mycoplasma] phocae]